MPETTNLTDGLCVIGTVQAVTPLIDKNGNTWAYSVTLDHSRGTTKIQTRPSAKTMMGEFDLPAFTTLTTGDIRGQEYQITLGVTTNNGFTNLNAIDAHRL